MRHNTKFKNSETSCQFQKCDQCIGITPHSLSKTGKLTCALCKSKLTYSQEHLAPGKHSYAA